MEIFIWDMDWTNGLCRIPDINCMQLSSLHQQLGDTTKFVNEELDLSIRYDILYIKCNSRQPQLPKKTILDDKRTRLLGKRFVYYNTYEIPKAAYSCRPDYLLYPEEKSDNSYTKANMLRFYYGKTLIKKRQDFHNTKSGKKRTIVCDGKYFWDAPEEEIIFCLEELKKEKNIVFLSPISLRKVLESKNIRRKFLDLNFSRGTEFKWRNDYGSNEYAAKEICKFLNELQSKTASKLLSIPIKAVENGDASEARFLECMEIVALFKKNKQQAIIYAPKDPLSTINWKRLKLLEDWTTNAPKLSFIEYALSRFVRQHGLVWYNILNNPSLWTAELIDEVLYFISSPIFENYRWTFFIQWGEDYLNQNLVNFDTIQKNISLLYRRT